MEESPSSRVTSLLSRLRSGDVEAESDLVCLVYDELHRMAAKMMRNERQEHTLQPTALVHETFLRLRPNLASAQNRRYLFSAARTAMRRVLIDHARSHNARERADAGAIDEVVLPDTESPWPNNLVDALKQLEQLDPRLHQVVEYRFLVGLKTAEIAEQLGVSESQVYRDWRCARAWLFRCLGREHELQ